MSIGRRQAEAIASGFIDTLGNDPYKPGEFPVVNEIMLQAAGDFLRAATANLNRADAVDRGELANSITVSDIQVNGSVYELTVGYPSGSDAAGYWDYVNKGVKGLTSSTKAPGSPYQFKKPWVTKGHALAILKWIRRQGITVRSLGKSGPQNSLEVKRKSVADSAAASNSAKGMAYAIAGRQKQDGIKATHYFDDATKTAFGPEFMQALAVAFGGEVLLAVRQFSNSK